MFARCAVALHDAIDDVFDGWIVRCVTDRLPGGLGDEPRREVLAQAAAAAAVARREVMPELAELLGTDVDLQAATPMAVLRRAVRYPSDVLVVAGIEPPTRDDVARRLFPDDLYDLSPARFADVDPSLAQVGLMWGAAKAHLALARRRPRPADPQVNPADRP